jgi:hypothetical protein
MVPNLTHAADSNISSYHQGVENSANKSIKKFLNTVKKKYGN